VLTDDLGSVRTSITNQAGTATVAGYMGYGPFGFVQYHAGQTDTNKGYTGQYTDPLSGLDYYVARYYDPVAGLFLSADTVQSNLQGFDPYAYVNDNPETGTDPTGHCWPWCTIIAGAVAGVVAAEVTGLIMGQQPSWSTLAEAALAGAAVATVGVWGLGVLAEGGLLTGVFGTIASSLVIGSSSSATWGGIMLAGLGVGAIEGAVQGTVASAWNNITSPPPVRAPGPSVKHTPTPQSTPTINVRQNRSPITTINHPSPVGLAVPTVPTRPGTPHPSAPGNSHPPFTSSITNWFFYTVVSGDTLWGIASRFYGSGLQWQRIYQANRGVIGSNPNLIYVGERLRIMR